jgi:hypothetical protein
MLFDICALTKKSDCCVLGAGDVLQLVQHPARAPGQAVHGTAPHVRDAHLTEQTTLAHPSPGYPPIAAPSYGLLGTTAAAWFRFHWVWFRGAGVPSGSGSASDLHLHFAGN